jgi:hypothetical protein
MRRAFVVVLTFGLLAAVALPAASSTSAKKKPVKLEGKVNNKGVDKVKNGAVEIEADEFFFDGTFIKGKAGDLVEVTVSNEGAVEHTFTIDDLDIDEELQPGASVTVDVEIPADGSPLTGFCKLHVASGMQFAFFSKKGGATRSDDSGGSDDDGGAGGYSY